MIPTRQQIEKMWDTFDLPERKRLHCALVAKVAVYISSQFEKKGLEIHTSLLEAAALLHDIDKNVPNHENEGHPDAAVRILTDAGMKEIADIVGSHALHTILNPITAPKTPEEKILFLSDKMVKYSVITVDERFRLWGLESISPHEQDILGKAYPSVKHLEHEIFSYIGITPQDVAKYVK